MPIRIIVTAGTVADCTQAEELIRDTGAEHLIADRGYDTDAIVASAEQAGMVVVIPSKKNRKEARGYDAYLYKLRHLVENTILRIKEWRGVATRYTKRTSSFLAFVQLRCAMLWIKIS